jgi:DnaD/phage-associated family protein
MTSRKNSSVLLINEPPLQVLPSLAVAIGLNEAIAVQQVHYWIGLSKNIRDGRVWVFKTYPEWKEEFPFWSENTIGRIIRKLEEDGILISTDTYNAIATDRTKWYSIDYDSLSSRAPQVGTLDDPKLVPSRAPQVGTLLPETTQRIQPESSERPNIFTVYEQNCGVLTPFIASELNYWLDLVQESWIEDAIKIAVLNNKRSMGYIAAIIKRWQNEGKDDGTGNGHKQKVVQDPWA